MSDEIFKEIRSAVVQAGLKVCWAQWSALGSYAAPVRMRRPDLDRGSRGSYSPQSRARKGRAPPGRYAFVVGVGGIPAHERFRRIRTLAKDFPEDVATLRRGGMHRSLQRPAIVAGSAAIAKSAGA